MILAIDIGGTKTLLGLFEEDGTLKNTYKFQTPQLYTDFVRELGGHIPSLVDVNTLSMCVVAAPGRVDRTRGIGLAFGNLAWENVPLVEDIQKITNTLVAIENDANLAGLAEALLVPEYRKVQYVTVSTGIGGGLIIDGRLDPLSLDAEIGQMMLEHEGRLVTWEHLASGKTITATYGKRASDITDPSAWYVIARNIAIGLINVIVTVAPDAVIVGGGVGSNLDKFADKLLEELKIYKPEVADLPPILKAQNPEEAVIYGCYALSQQS